MKCRFCKTPLESLFVTLGVSPVSNSYIKKENLQKMEPFYPLDVYVCGSCFLVQLDEYEKAENIFDADYAYFSSYSQSWLEHSKAYVGKMTDRFGLDGDSLVIEIASNDGYLLQYFLEKKIPVLGIEPTESTAKVAREKGINTETVFFGVETASRLAKEDRKADLLLGNNVLAHVPDLNDFVKGLKIALNPMGIITMEFPHLLQLIEQNQFDTIYHEHFSYLSLIAVETIFKKHGLTIFDIDEIPTHGGSLRIYAKHDDNNSRQIEDSVKIVRDREIYKGFNRLSTYQGFQSIVDKTKRSFLKFLIEAKENNKTIVGYGAAAKGNTLLNFCGVKHDFIDYVVDKNIHKQGKYLPGTHILVEKPEKIKETKPDYLVILPWNIKDEVIKQNEYIREWGGKFVVPIPNTQVI